MKAHRFDALVNYPGLGSLWLDDVTLRDGHLVGTALERIQAPVDGAYFERVTMNFPLSCVRKVVRIYRSEEEMLEAKYG